VSAASSATAATTLAVVSPRAAHFLGVSDPGTTPLGSLKFDAPVRVSACDFLGRELASTTFLAGCTSGTVAAYRVPATAGLAADPVTVFGPASSSSLSSSSLSSGAVKAVAACPYDVSAFATAEDETFSVWSTEAPDPHRPALNRRPIAGGAITRFSWSPHLEAVAALATADGTLVFIDIRLDKPVVARREMAHGRLASVSAIAWSPYVANWLATGGSDSAVNVWDLRWAA
jgi:WD40 repeat protein